MRSVPAGCGRLIGEEQDVRGMVRKLTQQFHAGADIGHLTQSRPEPADTVGGDRMRPADSPRFDGKAGPSTDQRPNPNARQHPVGYRERPFDLRQGLDSLPRTSKGMRFHGAYGHTQADELFAWP